MHEHLHMQTKQSLICGIKYFITFRNSNSNMFWMLSHYKQQQYFFMIKGFFPKFAFSCPCVHCIDVEHVVGRKLRFYSTLQRQNTMPSSPLLPGPLRKLYHIDCDSQSLRSNLLISSLIQHLNTHTFFWSRSVLYAYLTAWLDWEDWNWILNSIRTFTEHVGKQPGAESIFCIWLSSSQRNEKLNFEV